MPSNENESSGGGVTDPQFKPGWYDIVSIVTTRCYFQREDQIDTHVTKLLAEVQLQFGEMATVNRLAAVSVEDPSQPRRGLDDL